MFKVWFASKLALCGWSWKNTLPNFSNLTSKSKIKQTETLLLLSFFILNFRRFVRSLRSWKFSGKFLHQKKMRLRSDPSSTVFHLIRLTFTSLRPSPLSESQHDGDTSLDRSIIPWGMGKWRRNCRDEENGKICQAANPQTNNNFLDFIPFFSPFGELCKLYAIVRKRDDDDGREGRIDDNQVYCEILKT